ncbi:MAG TPA: aldolase/citrate lyase family protein [Pseudonocardia sp.]|uniref:HpcH/HpaI aldolase family protein n=1 Tax=Pseudonocardia sp. TaxID=60912 RepID=UPI002B4B36AB|nr:aldolase/citrate lyase family protein [Pseudonocardia sp.]HLU60306.1 aldolase/citrate lyase family protein [Pseudonocardia sp.]
MSDVLPAQALGTWVKLSSPTTVEIMAHAGFDFVVVDLEHTLLDLGTAQTMISLARASGLAPLVRVPDHAASTIQRVLDAGAAGVLVPHVDTAEQADALARACRFPPHGTRGAGSTGHAGRWGRLPRADYVRYGNEQVLCIPQLESAQAVREARAIAAVPGVDAVFLGAADLAMDVGRSDVSDLLAAARAAAGDAGVPVGSAAGSPSAASAALDAGDAFVICTNDASMLAAAAADTVAAIRRGSTATS